MSYLDPDAGRRREPGSGKIETNDLHDGSVNRTKLTAPAGRKAVQAGAASIATTGNTDVYVIVPEAGQLDSIDFSSIDALAANDTNYVTFSVVNLGQGGSGSTAMLAATNPNTTKATGGAALTANARRQLALNGTPANLNVAAGDKLRIRMAVTGTLGSAVNGPLFLVRFKGTT